MSNNGSNGKQDPIDAARLAQAAAQARGTQLAGALHTLLGLHEHRDVINACILIAAARAKMAGMKRADLRTMAGQMFDSVTLEPTKAPSAVLAP